MNASHLKMSPQGSLNDDDADDDPEQDTKIDESVLEAIRGQQLADIAEFDRILQESAHELDREFDGCEAPNTWPSVRMYRNVLRWLGQFNRVSYFDTDSPGRRAGRVLLWPILAKIFYLYCVIKVSIYVYYQYVHDLNLYKAKTLKSYLATANVTSSPTNEPHLLREYQSIERRIADSREFLHSIGAPFLNITFFVEIGYFYIHSLSFLTYFMGTLFFRFIAPLHFRLAKVLLDTSNEKINCIEATQREIHRFLESSKIFNLAEREIFAAGSNGLMAQSPTTMMAYQHLIDKQLVLCDHETTIEQLKGLASRGRLYPLYWSKESIVEMSPYHLAVIVGCHIYGLILMAGIGVCLPMAGDMGYKQYGWPDYLMLTENSYITVVLVIGVSFYCSVVFSSCTDQILYIRRLKISIDKCAHDNKFKYHQLEQLLLDGSPQSIHRLNCELMSRDMNSNLLFVFIQFKILVDQLLREIKSYGIFAFITMIIIFNLPIAARLHEPYLNDATKMIQFCFFPATVLYLDTVLIPICLVHNCTSDLYRSLSYLLAHIVETSRLQYNHQTGTVVHLYNAHLVWLLRKELCYPDIFLRQFATSILGIHFTFQTLIKIHLWLGVLMISIWIGAQNSDGGTLLGGFLNDPFNILQLPSNLLEPAGN